MDNRTIAQQLTNRARYLVDHNASLYRVQAYRRAAETVLGLDEAIERIVADRGHRGLQELPSIGAHIARTIATLVRTGAMPMVNEEPPKPQSEHREPWGSKDLSCNACGVSSK